MKIGIIGSGYVGLVTGTCFSHLGHQVLCVDNNLKKVAMLKKGHVPIYEPGLGDLIKKNIKAKRLSFSSNIAQAVRECEILFISVNTPPKENGEADLSFVENVSLEIARNLKKSFRLIVEKSTVPVQTGDRIFRTIKENQPKGSSFEVASNPEFLREGSAIQDFLNPDRVVLGVESKKAEKLLRKLYEPLNARIVVTDIKSAEIIKHASNSFLATKISFINVVARVCQAVGADIEKVADGMGLDPRIGKSFLKAGVGFGGSCFPKDLAAFLQIVQKLGIRFNLLQEVLTINEEQKQYFVSQIEQALWNLKGKTIAVLGLSFKPDTDDMRFAPSVSIIKALQQQGVRIKAYDPEAIPKARPLLEGVIFTKDPYQAVKDADAVAVLTEWKEFLDLNFKRVHKLLRQPLIFDGRNMFDPFMLVGLGFQYHGLGRKV